MLRDGRLVRHSRPLAEFVSLGEARLATAGPHGRAGRLVEVRGLLVAEAGLLVAEAGRLEPRRPARVLLRLRRRLKALARDAPLLEEGPGGVLLRLARDLSRAVSEPGA